MNRRRTDINGEAVTCTVAGIQTELRFDYEHQPDEPAAGLREGYVIGLMVVQLTQEMWMAIGDAFGDCVEFRIDGASVPVSVSLDSITIGRGSWEVRSDALEQVLAEWLWQQESNRMEAAMEPFSLRDDLIAIQRVWMRANGVGV